MTTPTLMLEFADRVGGMSSRLMKRMHVNKWCTEVHLTPVRAVYKSMRTMSLQPILLWLEVLAVVACVSLAVRARVLVHSFPFMVFFSLYLLTHFINHPILSGMKS